MKKAQSSVMASILIIIVALGLILYIMFIPPADREAILSGNIDAVGNYGSSSSSSSSNNGILNDENSDFLFTGPGYVDDVTEGESVHTLPAINLRTRVNSQILSEDSAFYVTQSFRVEKDKIISFFVENLDIVDDIYLTFITSKNDGVLTISLNDNVIYEGDMEKSAFSPLKISKSMLQKNNIVEFKVEDVGLFFWKKNEYIIEDFKVYGDVIETSGQSSYTTFDLGSNEFKFLKRAALKFYPSCDQASVGTLKISLNNNIIFNQIPDCDVLNIYDLPKSYLMPDVNGLTFETVRDSYLIDRISVDTTLSENNDYIYYFDLDSDLFNSYQEAEPVCGEVDGYCVDGCSADLDKDCCFMEYSGEGYWCDVPTSNTNDRCVGRVDDSNVYDCRSGYEDKKGNPHDNYDDEELCGDDTDDFCPVGCSADYDKDCCLVKNSGNFWCDDLPITGVSGVCVGSVTNDQCTYCPYGYEGEDYDPECTFDSRNQIVYESDLSSDYNVRLILKFVDDDERKRGVIRINGYETSFSTYDDETEKFIDDFLEEGSNYVQILPQNDFNLVSIRVRVEED